MKARSNRLLHVAPLLGVLAQAPAFAQPAAESSASAPGADEAAASSESNAKAPEPGMDSEKAREAIEGVGRSLGLDLGKDRHYAGGYRAMGEDFFAKRITKAELDERVAAMQANRSERRKDHLQGLKLRWGALLAHSGSREELRFHAKREARLARALFLAHTEAPAEVGKKLVQRIEALIDKEEERHIGAMEKLRQTPAEPSASAAPSAAPPPVPAEEAKK